MIRRLLCRGVFALFGVSMLFTLGCASTKPSKFYILQSSTSLGAENRVSAASGPLSVGIGPVKIPDYLDRPQIVTRTSLNELQLAEFDRWAEPLGQSFSRTLAENLSILLSSERVFIFPWSKSSGIQYQVAVDIIQFEGAPGGKVILNAHWTIFSGEEKKILTAKSSIFTEPVDSAGFSALVSAESRAVAALSREVASALTALSP